MSWISGAGLPKAVVMGGYKRSTVRFTDGDPCCTSTYNHRMDDEEKELMARRIAAALNATRHMTLGELERMALERTL